MLSALCKRIRNKQAHFRGRKQVRIHRAWPCLRTLSANSPVHQARCDTASCGISIIREPQHFGWYEGTARHDWAPSPMQWISQRLQIFSEGSLRELSLPQSEPKRHADDRSVRLGTTVHFRATVEGRRAMSAFIVLFIAICLFGILRTIRCGPYSRWPSAVSMVSDNRMIAGSTDRLEAILTAPGRTFVRWIAGRVRTYGPARFAIARHDLRSQVPFSQRRSKKKWVCRARWV